MALPRNAKIISAVLLIAVAYSVVLYLNHSESGASTQSTNDAYVQAEFTAVAPQVSGMVAQVLIEDNQLVKAGELIATIDERDFVVAAEVAKAQVASARANINSQEAHLLQQESAIRQAQAILVAEEAALVLARENETRYRNLAADGSGTIQALQQAEAQLAIQLASREKSQAGLQMARQQIDILKAGVESARAALALAQASQAAAELKLSYTRIYAPTDGIIGQKAVRVGAFITAGKPLLVIVPLDDVYIAANFRETQLERVQPGQGVEIKVDALPSIVLKGTVESLGPASGVSYSAVSPHNATGNFTKIVQRLPVRIRINPDQPEAEKLRVGMSVTPKIYIDE
jgi:membrane fusion protein, multidrug efflux system